MTELPLDRAYHWERTRPQEVFLTQPMNGVVRDWTWAQTMDEARRMASHLIAKNWPAGLAYRNLFKELLMVDHG